MLKLKVKRLETLKEKIVGLIGREKVAPVIFETRFGIHTFFLSTPIDVLILDSQRRVAVFKESLFPNRIFLWNPRYKIVLELPAGTIKQYNVKKGTRIQPVSAGLFR
ncbi:MAG: DUF192 domain-containing protein [Patescibacteria group bacterium]